MHKILLFLLLLPSMAQSQVLYLMEFDSPPATSGTSYTGTTTTLDTELGTSGWTTDASFTNYNGSSGKALSLNNSGGTPKITLTLQVSSGKQMDISSLDFWTKRSTTGAQNWALSVNGSSVSTGNVSSGGSFVGPITPATPLTGLTGTVTIELSLSGATGSGTFRLDDFTIEGTITDNIPTSLTSVDFNCIANGRDVLISWAHDQEEEYFSISRTDLEGHSVQILSDVKDQKGKHLDKNLPTGEYLYKLYQNDINGNKVVKSVWVNILKDFSISIHPNPVKNTLYIQNLEDASTITVYTTQGQIVKQYKALSNQNSIDISSLVSGMYILKINNSSYSFVKQ